MSKDTIYRQDAIDAFGLSEKTRKYGGDHSGYDTMMLYEIQNTLESLPSAQPEITLESAIEYLHKIGWMQEHDRILTESAQSEPSTEIQEILEYLDTTLHPIVSPDNWNVYAELYDMVSKLPSEQPDYTAIKSEIITNIEEFNNAKHHAQWVQNNGKMIAFGLELALCIIEEKERRADE